MADYYVRLPQSTSGGGVTSLNGQTGALTLVAGSNITITPGSGTLTIASTGGSSGDVFPTPDTLVLRDGSGNIEALQILDSSAVLSIDATSRTLNNSAGVSVLEWPSNVPNILQGHADLVLDNGRAFGIYASAITPTGTEASSSGTIPDGVYAYKMTVVINGDETLAGIASFISLSDGGTNSVLVSTNLIVGATQYRYYRATNPTLIYGFLGTNNSGANYFDDGSVTPDTGIQPPTTSTAQSIRISNQGSLITGQLTGSAVSFTSSGAQFYMQDGGGIQAYTTGTGEGFLFGSNSGDFNLYSSGAGLQFGANGGVNLYGTNGFNLSVGPGSTAYFHGNNSGLEFNFDGTSLLYTTKFQINMVGGQEIFETDLTTGVRVWDAGGTISADFQARALNSSSSSEIFNFLDSTRGLTTPSNFTATESSSRIAVRYTGTPTLLLGPQTNGGSLVDTTTYYWVATAIIQGGLETNASNEQSFTMASPDLTQELTCLSIPGATEYRLYRGTTSGVYDGYYYSISPSPNINAVFTDDGTTSPTVQQPPTESLAPHTQMWDSGFFSMGDCYFFGNLRIGGANSQITDQNGSGFIDVNNRILKSQVGGLAVIFDDTERSLRNLGGGTSAIFGVAGYSGIAFPNDIFNSNDSTLVAKTNDRTLIDSSGSIALDWSNGLKANATISGTATLVAGTVTVSSVAVLANSIIMLTIQNGTGLDSVSVSGRNVGTDFTITSSNALDTSDVGWFILQQ